MTLAKKILVISDNPNLVYRFVNEVWTLVDNLKYNLAVMCSPFSKIETFKVSTGVSHIDLRNASDIEKILEYELVISIHCKQLFPDCLLNKVRCINVHPGYNPINRGWYPQVFSIINNLEIGATIHEIDEKLDHGKIIKRQKVEKLSYDTSLSLYNRIINTEIELLKTCINEILENRYDSFIPECEGVLYLKKDFNELCKLDMNMEITMGKAIDILRALSHGNYKNAYFINEFGKKIFVSINLNHE